MKRTIPPAVLALMPKHRYLAPITRSERLLIVRVPHDPRDWDTPNGVVTKLKRALFRIGIMARDVHGFEGFDPWHTSPLTNDEQDKDAAEFFRAIDEAFAGSDSKLSAFELYDLDGERLVAVRPAMSKPGYLDR